MERKIGEIFEHNGEWYQCVQDDKVSCEDCDFTEYCESYSGNCDSTSRKDGKGICFKKLEKVGEPYMCDEKIVQRYKIYYDPLIAKSEVVERYVPGLIDIAIKQNQEDMEEKKMNLKPFDLEAARSGKPVCTRSGNKARIICFDVNMTYKNVNYPIVAVIESEDGEESVCSYNEKGKVLVEDEFEYKEDLMMLPEKKEGWVNLYRYSTPIYGTEEKAMSCVGSEKMNDYIGTVKVQWYE